MERWGDEVEGLNFHHRHHTNKNQIGNTEACGKSRAARGGEGMHMEETVSGFSNYGKTTMASGS